MADLLALAERCEKATFPCLDDASAHELVEIQSTICHLMLGHGYDAYSPDYVGSLDAAMTLVPEGWIWNVSSTGQAWLDKSDHDLFYGDAPTPALALCAASLRARHAIGGIDA